MVKIKVDRFLFVIVAFIMIYSPPVGHIRSLLLLFPISGLYIFFNFRYIKKNYRSVLNQYFIWLLLFIYILLVALCNNNQPSFLRSMLYILASVIPSSIMIASLMKKKEYDIHYFIDTILYAGLVQSIISLVSFFNRDIKNTFINLMISSGLFQDDAYTLFSRNLRFFGFSTGLTYGMPSVQGFLAIIALYLAVNNKQSLKYYFMIPFFAFSGIINARSSLIIIGIGIIAIIFSLPAGNTAKKIIRIFVIAILATVLIFFGTNVLRSISPNTYIWIEEGLSQIKMFFYGDTSSGYFSYVADNDRWSLPSGLNLLFGYGIRVLNTNKLGFQTDIGYINDMYFGGIVYMTILYILIIKYSLSLKNVDDTPNIGLRRFLCISFIVSFIVLNVKGYVFDLNNFFVLFIMFMVFFSGYSCSQSD